MKSQMYVFNTFLNIALNLKDVEGIVFQNYTSGSRTTLKNFRVRLPKTGGRYYWIFGEQTFPSSRIERNVCKKTSWI